MKITTTQLALTAFIIAIFFGIIRVGLEILTMLIDNPSTHLTACLIYTLWMSALGIWTLAKLLRISRDIDLDLNFQERDFHDSTPSNFTSFPGRTDNIIKTAQEFTDLERRQQAIADFQDHHNVPSCPVEQNGKQLARKFGPLGETLK